MAFCQIKAAQAAAWFLAQSGGSMTILKLMKLLYLADRQALRDLERPMTGDRMVSMPHGPVLSETLELANGQSPSLPQGWDCWIQDRADRTIALHADAVTAREQLTHISDAEFAVLQEVQRVFGHRDANWLSNFTHKHCEEWEDPRGSSRPIRYQTALQAVGKSPQQVRAIANQLKEDREMDALFASL